MTLRLVNASSIDVAVRRELERVNRRIMPFYGSFYDTTDQLNPVADAVNIMQLDSVDLGRGVTVRNDATPRLTQITFQYGGIYDVQFSAQVVKTDSNQDTMDIWLRQNGVDVPWTTTRFSLVGNNAKGVAAWDWMVQVEKNDYVQIAWCSPDVDVLLEAQSGLTVPTRPAIPSVIVTVLPVAPL